MRAGTGGRGERRGDILHKSPLKLLKLQDTERVDFVMKINKAKVNVNLKVDINRITTFKIGPSGLACKSALNPEGGTLRRAEPKGAPIVFTFHFIGVDYSTGIFKVTTFTCPF